MSQYCIKGSLCNILGTIYASNITFFVSKNVKFETHYIPIQQCNFISAFDYAPRTWFFLSTKEYQAAKDSHGDKLPPNIMDESLLSLMLNYINSKHLTANSKLHNKLHSSIVYSNNYNMRTIKRFNPKKHILKLTQESIEINNKLQCSVCNQHFLPHTLHNYKPLLHFHHDTILCSDCADKSIQICPECLKPFTSNKNSTRIEQMNTMGCNVPMYICETCTSHLVKCDICKRKTHKNKILLIDDTNVCHMCALNKSIVGTCRSCKKSHLIDNLFTDGDTLFCRLCIYDRVRINRKPVIKQLQIDTKHEIHHSIGIEFEGYTYLNNKLVPDVLYFKDWGSSRDTSILPPDDSKEYFAFELVSPPLTGEAVNQNLTSLSQHIRKFNIQTNESCGLHIHVGLNKLPYNGCFLENKQQWWYARQIMLLWLKIEALVFAITTPDRLNKRKYCPPLNQLFDFKVIKRAKETNEFHSIVFGPNHFYQNNNKYGQQNSNNINPRYAALNLYSLLFRGTVEFRPYHSTLNINEIKMWILFCQFIVDKAYQLSEKEISLIHFDSLKSILNVLNPPNHIMAFITNKIATNSNDISSYVKEISDQILLQKHYKQNTNLQFFKELEHHYNNITNTNTNNSNCAKQIALLRTMLRIPLISSGLQSVLQVTNYDHDKALQDIEYLMKIIASSDMGHVTLGSSQELLHFVTRILLKNHNKWYDDPFYCPISYIIGLLQNF